MEQGATSGELGSRLGEGRSLWDSGLRLLAAGTVDLASLRRAVPEPR